MRKYREFHLNGNYIDMGAIKCFEDIEAWQTARKLTIQIYSITNREPFSRDYGLVRQMRSATVSIMSNLAEGFESQTDRTFIRYLGIAKSSAGELRSQLYIAIDQSYISKGDFDSICGLCNRAASQIFRFIEYLKRSNKN